MSRARAIAAAGMLWLAAAGCQAAAQGDPTRQREDLIAFERDFFNVDHAYSPAARAEAVRQLADLRDRAGRVSDVRFVLSLAQIVALADNGHSAMLDRGREAATARVGVRLTPFGDGFFAVQAVAAHADLLGGRLVSIDRVPIERLRDVARTLRGGSDAWRDRWVPICLERPGELHALDLIRSATEATYRFQFPDGAFRQAMLRAEPASVGQWIDEAAVLTPLREQGEWRSLLTAELSPWALQDVVTPFRRRDAPDLDALVMQLRANVDARGQSIRGFLEASDADRTKTSRRNIVLDMRFNAGGNLQLTREYFETLPGRLAAGGRIVVLTSPWTFSAAISSVGYLKQAGGERVVLAGEAPGDRLLFWAEGRPVRLPHFDLMLLPATQRHDYLDGCRQFTDCHPYVKTHPIAVPNLTPEIAAPWTIEAYAAGRDPGMDAVARVLRGR